MPLLKNIPKSIFDDPLWRFKPYYFFDEKKELLEVEAIVLEEHKDIALVLEKYLRRLIRLNFKEGFIFVGVEDHGKVITNSQGKMIEVYRSYVSFIKFKDVR